MGGISARSMVRQKRKFKPRARTSRSLNLDSIGSAEGQRIRPPTMDGIYWNISPPLATRLYEKSALGRRNEDGSISLTASEVLFCHWHRHLPLPDEDWLIQELEQNPRLIYEAIIMDVGRNGGEMIVPSEHHPEYDSLSWGIRWHRDRNHLKDKHQASVSIATTHDHLDWYELLNWCQKSRQEGIDAEMFVIDDELDVTMYKMDLIQPKGDLTSWNDLSESQQQQFLKDWMKRTPTDAGSYIRHEQPWSWEQIGIDHMSGRILRQEEEDYLQEMITKEHDVSQDSQLMHDLYSRGLLLRPGFKYGCRWRVYDGDLNESHAPWLIQPRLESATTWEGVCLSVRLAEGVHKQWVCAIFNNGEWNYLRIQRWSPGKNSSTD